MRRRKNYLIRRRFQLRWALRIALAGGLTAGGLAVFLWLMWDRETAALQAIEGANQEVYTTALDVGVLFLNLPNTTEKEARLINERLENTKRGYETARRRFEGHRACRYMIPIGLVAFVLLLTLALFSWGIIVSHRVAGPMHVIRATLERYNAEGVIPPRQLRRRDEFKEVFDLLCRTLASAPTGSFEDAGDET
jgi:hypothetical protein